MRGSSKGGLKAAKAREAKRKTAFTVSVPFVMLSCTWLNASGCFTDRFSSSTWYGATFQFADGSRRELDLSGRGYGLLAEGDRGMLTWRDTVFKGLDRSQASLAP